MGPAQGNTASKWQSGLPHELTSDLSDFPAQSLLYFTGGILRGKKLRKDIFVCAEAQITECALSLSPLASSQEDWSPTHPPSSLSSTSWPLSRYWIITYLRSQPWTKQCPPCCLSWAHEGDGPRTQHPFFPTGSGILKWGTSETSPASSPLSRFIHCHTPFHAVYFLGLSPAWASPWESTMPVKVTHQQSSQEAGRTLSK